VHLANHSPTVKRNDHVGVRLRLFGLQTEQPKPDPTALSNRTTEA